jgi:uncharacterized protein with PQ loop repeat
MSLELLGWAGSILLAFCGLPQAYHSYKFKNSDGMTWGMLLMWGFGELLTIIYILPKFYLPLLFNYTANLVFIGIIVFYKIKPVRNT